ncbi:colanic acid/amylovoran biosynthesis glycosyltransferase [Ereboglobus sp. PH5-5]|uniref:glycosyltransferase n=1 Tax=Ereboglobus sp. PH5-5 TaxID=2940529 RepID=UPI0024073206|nr:glycosyltransferase [Ereboglobus sp. PH5-5]MDF9834144.1 colanic acid/amylovoran biosynthesis glycosyltransferase [Ereboglobus sp. PH5-5]
MHNPRLKIAYLFTTFPKNTETFLQREIIAMHRLGADLRIYSFWGGGGTFCGLPVRAFNKWRLLELFWIIPWVAVTRWDVFGILLRGLLTRRAPSWINFWENMLGAGFAGVFYRAFKKDPPSLIHAAWSGAPATAAWCLSRLNKIPYSAAAHAYDIYEHGGDWWLDEKLADARFIHTSTAMGRATLVQRGVSAGKVRLIRRGLDAFPIMNPLRPDRSPIRIVCVGRLVEKKGFTHQMRIYGALRDAGVAFEARIIGDGPLRETLEQTAAKNGVADKVTLMGHLALPEVWRQLQWADVLIHTGVVARSGDRDGLPNVIPEAMSAGVLVITSPAAATTEAIHHGETGLVADVEDISAWVTDMRRLATDDLLAESLRAEARRWVEENFDAHKNASQLHACFELAAQTTIDNTASSHHPEAS